MKHIYRYLHWASTILRARRVGLDFRPAFHLYQAHAGSCITSGKLTPKQTISDKIRFECLWPANLPPATEWGYNRSRGPQTWPDIYPDAGGKNQSPINIVTSLVKTSDFIEEPLAWRYEKEICKSIMNTGCGWRVDVAGGQSELSGGPLSHKYELVQFHAHWGNSNCCGSEHLVDGKSFSGELHFVHWNKDLYESCAEACHSPDGLTVLGVLLEIGEENSEIEKLCQIVNEIPEKDKRADIPSDVDPVLMYPVNRDYWTYKGSLTTPPCYESVTWIVFKNPISVTEQQLDFFRGMQNACKCEEAEVENFVTKNFRPPQPLNDRHIWEWNY